MDFFGYEKISKNRKVDLNSFFYELEKYLKKIWNVLKNKKGNSTYPTDPTLETSWGAVGNPSGWFVESKEYKQYLDEKNLLMSII